MIYTIREATPANLDAMLALFPRLAAFDLPPKRTPQQLWRGDAALLKQWAAGNAPNCQVRVAVDAHSAVVGVALVQLRDEMLSHEPSAHLEVLVVADNAEGNGIGQALIHAAEHAARERGALSMTLHVFAANSRARHLYDSLGYSGELIRYIKHFE